MLEEFAALRKIPDFQTFHDIIEADRRRLHGRCSDEYTKPSIQKAD